MSRLRWPDSTNSVSEKPGTIHAVSSCICAVSLDPVGATREKRVLSLSVPVSGRCWSGIRSTVRRSTLTSY